MLPEAEMPWCIGSTALVGVVLGKGAVFVGISLGVVEIRSVIPSTGVPGQVWKGVT